MAKAHQIAIASETGAFEKGIKSGVIQPLEDAEKALDGLAKSKGADGLDRSMEQAQDSTKKLKKEIKETADAIDQDFRAGYAKMKTSAQDASDSAGRSLHSVSDSAAEASGELTQNLGETFSSFRGDMEDLPQIAQDVFGGLAGSVGGLGPAFALAAGAAGIGLLINAFNTAGEESDEFKQRAAELAQAYIDAGGEAAPAIEDIADAIREMATATEEGVTNLEDLRDVADKSGNSYEDLAKAMAGDVDGLKEKLRAGEERLKQLQEEGSAYDQNNEKAGRSLQTITDQTEGQRQYNDYLREASAAAESAAQAEKNWVEAGGEQLQIKAELVDQISDAYDGVRDSAINAATSEDGVFNVDAWAEKVEQSKGQVEQYKANIASIKLSSDQWRNLMEMPEDARMAVAASLAQGPEEAKGKIISALTDAGASAASGAQVSFDEGFNPEADVEVTADTSEAERKLKETAKKRDTEIAVKATGVDEVNRALDAASRERVGKVRLIVDDTAVRNYVPPIKTQVVRMRPQYTE
ncbi:hypothetical protein [Microbacterium testaceum]|uniref:Uncharacterized protein n=1 Tax=Microbacterium testaceum TaxID=2033 RepID=A0A2T7WND9_MICTE|nr:hypothetical protein [Microbacterium testaceum]PVE76100.1 hypothetical protein DC432_06605 [Microbacterium testaceum]